MDRQSCSLADVVWMPMRYIDGGRALVHTAKSPTARFALASCSISARAFVRLCVDVSRLREREVGSQTALWRGSTLLSNFMASKNDRGGREWDHERPVNDASKPDATADAAAAIRDPGWTWSVKALCMKSFVPQAICALRQVIRPAWCAVMTERGRHTLLALCDGESHRRQRGRESERERDRDDTMMCNKGKRRQGQGGVRAWRLGGCLS